MALSNSQWLANPGVTYEIDQSIRFNDDDSAYLNRTPGSAGNRRTFTFSCWVKRANITSANAPIFSAGGDDWLMFLSANTLGFNSDGTNNYRIVTTQLFRDPGAWMHVVLRVDTTNATAGDRLRLYINGSEVTDLGTDTNPTLNLDTAFNNTGEHSIGKLVGSSQYFDGYLAEINHIDGSSLGPGSFGETNSDTGQWVPKKYSGSYGTNGFFIDGRDSSDLGDDESGNGNDYASNNLATADQVTDSPTNNMPTLNSLSTGTGALSDGNLQYTGVSGNWSNSRLTLLVPETGKWAIRMKSASSYQQIIVGLCAPDTACPYTDIDVNGVVQIRYNTDDGNFVTRVGGSLVNDTGAPTTSAQTFFQLLFDMDNGKLGVAADGASSGTFADISTYSSLDLHGTALKTARQPFVQAYAGTDSDAGVIIDVGQSGWETTVTGFKNLTLANAYDEPAIADPSKYFQSTLYTGNGSTQSINQSGNSTFQPDWVWIKNRDAADSHIWTDAVRGATKIMESNDADAEVTDDDTLTGFESDGFALGDDDKVNTNTENYVAWQWKANGAGSSNEDGTINTTATSVNTTTGVSISTYTGTGSNATVGHGLGVVPKMVIAKRRNSSESWRVWHNALTDGSYFLNLENTDGQASVAAIWNSTAPTSSVVSVGTNASVNGSSDTHVMYAFADIEGFSKFGTYTGNNSTDGAFVYTGFKPAFLMFKVISTTDSWQVYDTARQNYNVFGRSLTPNADAVESSFSARVDLLSNGFKARSTNTAINGSQTYIYMAYAETPFKTATAR